MSKGGPFIAFYPSDWLAGTRGLTAAETGVYITLVAMMYERQEPLTFDEKRLARLCGLRADAFLRALDVLEDEGKITRQDGGLWNERVSKELLKRQKIGALNAQNAAARWEKDKQKQRKADANAMRTQCETDANQNQTHKKERTKVLSQKGTRLPEDWVLPREWGEWAVSEGWPEVAIREEASKFRDYWISKSGKDATKRDWLATWRNWMRNSKTPKGDANASGKTDRLRGVISAAATGTSREDWPQSAGHSEPVLDGGRTGRREGDGAGELDGPSPKPDRGGNQGSLAVLPARPREPDSERRVAATGPGSVGADSFGEASEAYAGLRQYAARW